MLKKVETLMQTWRPEVVSGVSKKRHRKEEGVKEARKKKSRAP